MHYGDIPPYHKEMMEQLHEMETYFTSKMATLPLDRIAQGYICCAHDWFDLECEEDGERLLKLAEAVCPGYFSDYLPKHMMEDELFAILVHQLNEKMGKVLENRQG